MIKRTTVLGIFLVLVLISCAQTTGTLEGSVSIGPLCPVERNPPEPSCQPSAKTFQAWPIVVMRDGKKMRNIVPAADGTFSMDLAPGTYVIDLEKQQHIGTSGLPATVVVKSGKVTTFDISIDTGIR